MDKFYLVFLLLVNSLVIFPPTVEIEKPNHNQSKPPHGKPPMPGENLRYSRPTIPEEEDTDKKGKPETMLVIHDADTVTVTASVGE